MKTKLRTMLLAAAGVLGSVAVAHAQPAPEPAPAPAPPPVPPPAPPAPAAAEPPAVAPAAMPAAPPPVAAAPVNWGGTPPAPDAVKPTEAPKKPNPWGFTRFTWNNSGSTKIFGVGGPYIGTEDEVYSMDFGLNVRYTFISEPKDKVYVNASGGVEVELTDGETVKKRVPLLRDTSIGLGYSHNFYKSADKETSTGLLLSGGVSLPTSDLSRYQGKYAGTSLTAAVIHGQKLAGSKSDWFPDVLFFGSVNWGHTFSRGYTPTSTELAVTQRPRQVACDKEAGCLTDQSDQLSGYSLAHDTLRLGVTYYLSIYKDVLSFGNSWEIAERYKYSFADTCVNLPSTPGCEPAGRLADATTRGALTTFDVSLSYAIPQNLGRVDLGYVNTSNQIGEDGKRRTVFYSPDAQFYMNLVAYFDGIYDKAASKADANNKQRVGALPRFRAQ